MRELFVDKLDVDAEVADILIAEGFASLEEVAYVPMQEMLEIESFDEDTVNELRTRAKDALLTMEIAREENVDDVSQDLRDLDGLTAELIAKLSDGGVHTRDDLADLAVDELTEMTGIDEEQAKALIMKAREHWFTDLSDAGRPTHRRPASRRTARHSKDSTMAVTTVAQFAAELNRPPRRCSSNSSRRASARRRPTTR